MKTTESLHDGLIGLGDLTIVRRRRSVTTSQIARWVLFAVPVAGHMLFRVLYYGDVVPNTFHAKVSGGFDSFGRGLYYASQYFLVQTEAERGLPSGFTLPLVVLAIPGVCGFCRPSDRSRSRRDGACPCGCRSSSRWSTSSSATWTSPRRGRVCALKRRRWWQAPPAT